MGHKPTSGVVPSRYLRCNASGLTSVREYTNDQVT
jgi:hypothetical protein